MTRGLEATENLTGILNARKTRSVSTDTLAFKHVSLPIFVLLPINTRVMDNNTIIKTFIYMTHQLCWS